MKHFRPFRFDDASGTLWRARQETPLTRKAADLLRLFLDRSGIPLSHQEIMGSVWPDTHVQTQNIKTLVHELRTALGDHVQQPQFIRADPGRGYTFLADATDAPVPLCDPDQDGDREHPLPVVGRDREVALLRELLNTASTAAERQVVLIEGERGSGKTTLCRALAEHARCQGARVSFAQALELAGPGEPFAVLSDGLDLLGRQYPSLLATTLQRHAPSWRERALRDFLASGDADASAGQSLRELTRVFEELSQDVPLVFVLDDLQWSDVQTIEWLGAMARRRVPSRLLIAATFCSSEREGAPNVPLLDRLSRHLSFERCGYTIRLNQLSDRDVADDLTRRFGEDVAAVLAEPLARSTGGNPRLIVGALDALVNVGLLRSTASGWRMETPTDGVDPILASSLVGGFEWQLDRLSDEDRAMLAAAAAVGVTFTAEDVAGVLESDASDDIAGQLQRLSRRHVLVRSVPGQDGSEPSNVFTFFHPVAADVLLAHTPIPDRMRLARRIVDHAELSSRTRPRRRAATLR
jgi:DNA-binding winged helix-turn-helix (wHTH) protein